MKSVVRMSGLMVVILAMLAGPAFGQGFSPRKIWDLTVTVNAPNAIVWVDDVPAPGGTTRVSGGAHNVKVHAEGFFDFNGPVVVNGSMTLSVRLDPAGLPLTILVGAPGASIFVDGADVTGTTPLVAPGAHDIRVSAQGFQDYSSTIDVNAPITLNVVLQPEANAMLAFVIPPPFRDPDTNPEDPRGQVRIFVDDRLVNPNGEMEGIPIDPGRHRIRIASGAFSTQLDDLVAQPGGSYVVELSMDTKVQTIPSPR